MYDGTDSSWVFIRIRSRVFRFYTVDGTSSRYYNAAWALPRPFFLYLIFFTIKKNGKELGCERILHVCCSYSEALTVSVSKSVTRK
jgi:hypothetical protein